MARSAMSARAMGRLMRSAGSAGGTRMHRLAASKSPRAPASQRYGIRHAAVAAAARP